MPPARLVEASYMNNVAAGQGLAVGYPVPVHLGAFSYVPGPHPHLSRAGEAVAPPAGAICGGQLHPATPKTTGAGAPRGLVTTLYNAITLKNMSL